GVAAPGAAADVEPLRHRAVVPQEMDVVIPMTASSTVRAAVRVGRIPGRIGRLQPPVQGGGEARSGERNGLDVAGLRASVAVGRTAVVALLARFDDAVATDGGPAGEGGLVA